jgi:hypothetical protein
MKMRRLTNEEYEALAKEYEADAPTLSGKPGFLTTVRERTLVTELLPPDYARIVNAKAKALSMTPAEVIQFAIKGQFA